MSENKPLAFTTQQEKEAAIADLEQQLELLRQTKVSDRWKPRGHEPFWTIGQLGEVYQSTSANPHTVDLYFDAYNCFETQEDALTEADRRKIWQEYRAFAREKNEGWVPDYTNGKEAKYGVGFTYGNLGVDSFSYHAYFIAGVAFCEKEHAVEALEMFGDRLLLLCDNQ